MERRTSPFTSSSRKPAIAMAVLLLLCATPAASAQSPAPGGGEAHVCMEMSANDVPADAWDDVLGAIRGSAHGSTALLPRRRPREHPRPERTRGRRSCL